MSSQQRILVVGGTGMLGAPVARRLAKEGHLVKVLTRKNDVDPALFADIDNIQVVKGSVEDVASLQQAMQGCTGVHINLSGGPLERVGAHQVSQVASTMIPSTIQRITLISGVSTSPETATWYPGVKAKLDAEQAVKESGMNYSIFRCTMVMETLPRWQYLIGPQPTKFHWIAADDYASMVAKAFVTPAAANQTFYVYGPGPPLTLEEALNDYFLPIGCCDDSSSRTSIPQFPTWVMTIRSWLPGQERLRDETLPKFAWLAKISEGGDPQPAQDLLGAPTITIQQWCEDYVKRQQHKQETNTS
jgi:NADH dehydrogenase